MADKVKVKNPGGRPTKFDESMLPKIEKLMKQGASKAEVCLELDISYTTENEWCKEGGPYYNKKFSESVKNGLWSSQGWWEKQGRENLKERDFNYTGWIMNMKNRFGKDWRDKHDLEVDTSLTVNVVKFGEDE
jgi:hypothetical protein